MGNGMVWDMTSMIYGYARVSTGDQTTDLQKDALVKVGCDRIFTDVASGAKATPSWCGSWTVSAEACRIWST